jgi:ABC-type uncharacterized transport system substrate-binding protein
MNDFLKILQNMNSAATKPKQLLSRQASRHDKMRENRFGATHNQLHRYDRENEPRDRGAYRCRRQQSKTQHDYAERMSVQGRCQPANSDVLCGCNLTGVNFFGAEVVSKRLELLRELIPGVGRLAVLVNPSNATISETTVRDVEAAARGMGVQVQVFNASTSREIDAAFANLVREHSDAVFVSGDAFFTSRRVQLATLAARYLIPSSFSQREVTEAGGLMSYAANIRDTYRQAGVYVGRILKGAKPADLPVMQSTKFELVINAQTARMLGLTVPDKLLVAADEVIE